MRSSKSFKGWIFLIVLVMIPVGSVLAEGTFGDYMYGAGNQFGRGFENIVTSFAEIPCTIRSDMKDRGGSGFFPGLGMGTVYMMRRMLIGVCEVGSFFIPAERTIPRVCHEAKPAIA
ncbi:MAG: hypothetical protein V1882_00655 [Candidatus Omnitrophota bacterium]